MDRLNAIIKEHYSHEVKEADRGYENEHDYSLDFECTKKLVHEIYKHRDEVLMVLTKSQGSTMENVMDRLVDQMDEHNAFLYVRQCVRQMMFHGRQKVVHWMSHSQVDMFIFMVTH